MLQVRSSEEVNAELHQITSISIWVLARYSPSLHPFRPPPPLVQKATTRERHNSDLLYPFPRR